MPGAINVRPLTLVRRQLELCLEAELFVCLCSNRSCLDHIKARPVRTTFPALIIAFYHTKGEKIRAIVRRASGLYSSDFLAARVRRAGKRIGRGG
jgi:hypothetical protein